MKKQILDVAAELIQKHGLRKFTIDEIAAELRISKKTIYRYFAGKDDIIREYFEVAIASDREGIEQSLAGGGTVFEKLHALVYSSHTYRLPIALLHEAQLFFPDKLARIEDLRRFKVGKMEELLRQLADEGALKPDVNFGVLTRMVEEISDMFVDYDFLLEHGLTARTAIDEALRIIFTGIMREEAAPGHGDRSAPVTP